MNARAVAIWSGAALTGALITLNPVYRILMLACGLAFVTAAARKQVSLKGFAWLLLAAFLSSLALSTGLDHQGAHVIATLPPWLPLIGGAITVEAVAFGLTAGLGIAAAIAAVWPLQAVLQPHELVDALPGPLVRTGAVIGTALNLVPAVARSYRDVSEAQRLRLGQSRGLASAVRVVVPVTLTAMESSIQLAEAMEARAFGSGPRTRLRRSSWRFPDLAVALASALALGLFVFTAVSGRAGDWYPLPSVTAPPLDALTLAACALLAIPGLLWRSPSSTG